MNNSNLSVMVVLLAVLTTGCSMSEQPAGLILRDGVIWTADTSVLL